jgi:hypothetical protein
MQPSCPCSRDLNWTGKGLNITIKTSLFITIQPTHKICKVCNYGMLCFTLCKVTVFSYVTNILQTVIKNYGKIHKMVLK